MRRHLAEIEQEARFRALAVHHVLGSGVEGAGRLLTRRYIRMGKGGRP